MTRTLNHYVAASRIVLSAKPTDPETWKGLHPLMLSVHDYLLCRKCHKLTDRSNACDPCDHRLMTGVNTKSLVQCYMHLCNLLHLSPIYRVMCARKEDAAVVALVEEVLGVFRPSDSDDDGDVESHYSDGVLLEEGEDDETPGLNCDRPSDYVNLHEPGRKTDTENEVNHQNTKSSGVYERERSPGTSEEHQHNLDSFENINLNSKKNDPLKNQHVVKNTAGKTTNTTISCACGKRNDKRSLGRTITPCSKRRCLCFRNRMSCTSCLCVGCDNPFM